MEEEKERCLADAKILLRDGRPRDAVAMLQSHLERFPQNAGAWSTLAAAYFDLKEWPSACTAARRATDLTPDSSREWCNYGVVLRKSGDPAAAIKAQERALRLDPDNLRAQRELGKAYVAARSTSGDSGECLSVSRSERRSSSRKRTALLAFGLAVVTAAAMLAVISIRNAPETVTATEAPELVANRQDTSDHASADEIPSSPVAIEQTQAREGSFRQTDTVEAEAPSAAVTEPTDQAAISRVRARELFNEGRKLYSEQRYSEALTIFEEAARLGSNDAERWADGCRKRIGEDVSATLAAREAAQSAAEAAREANAPNLRPPAAVRTAAVNLAQDAVRQHIVVSIEGGSRGERFISSSVRTVDAQLTKYDDVVEVWSGTLVVSGIVQIPTVLSGGKVWKDYNYSVRVRKPQGQGESAQRLVADSANLSMR